MIRTLTLTYDKSNEDVPVLCVAENSIYSIAVLKIFTGERAEQLYKELTGQKVDFTVDGGANWEWNKCHVKEETE